MSCGVGHRHGSDPVFLWLWHRPVATTPIRPLAWEPPCAMGAALEKTKKKKKRKKEKPMQGGCEKTIICKPRNEALGETSSANTLILDF